MSGVHAIVLAAGAGARFGGGKLTAPWRGGALIDGALAAAFAAPVETVAVVTGADAGAVAGAARAWAARQGQGERLRLVHAAEHAEGLAASLRAGVAALPDGATGVLVFLGDMPAIPAGVAPRLVAALQAGAPAAIPVHAGRRGHPAAFARSMFAALLALRGDEGARRVLKALGPAAAEVPTEDPGVLADVDRPEDLAGLG